MEINMKNTSVNSLWKWALGAGMLVAGVQSVWAGCAGTLYFKKPADWPSSFFVTMNNIDAPVDSSNYNATSGYYEYDLANAGGEAQETAFGLSTSKTAPLQYILMSEWNGSSPYDPNLPKNQRDIKCPGAGNKVYVMQDPLHDGKTFAGSEPSNAKFFYFLVPQDEGWQSDNVMINIDGTKDTAMAPAVDMCGWYYMAFDGDKVPSSIVLYRKNEPTEQLGLNGMNEAASQATPINLATYFNAFNTNTLYFVPDEDDWNDLTQGGWATVDPGIPEAGDTERCSYKLAALIYDTDRELNKLFTDYNADKSEPCVGVHKDIVKKDLNPATKKPEYSGSANAQKCFHSESEFSTLFNYVPNVNEVQCFDMPFRHYGKDTRWGYDSDSNKIGNFIGGFYPLEHDGDTYTLDASGDMVVSDGKFGDANVVVINGVPQGPTWKARRKRMAEAPVPVKDTVKNFDQYCTTPGWPGGRDCNGLFNDGEQPSVWDWGTRQDWKAMNGNKNLPRNQHFCFESHAKFTYYEDQEFTFRGDDDIWVFINNKLVVDAGGPHLATPGHVVLKNLNSATAYGDGFLVPGNEYDLDIFFCDRRTSMSNVIIKTNMYIRQKQDITLTRDKTVTDSKSYDVCYSETGDGSCAAVAVGSDEGLTCCGSDFTNKPECAGLDISYWLVEGRKISDSTSARSKHITTPGQYNCIIDLTNWTKPSVGKAEDVCELGTGRYTLFMKIGNKSKQVATFRPQGEVDVIYRDGIAQDTNGVEMTGGRYSVTTSAMAGDWVPVYISSVHEPKSSSDPLDILPMDASNVPYTLNADPLMQVCLKVADDGSCAELLTAANANRTIGPTGVDTVFVTVLETDFEKADNGQKEVGISVVGRTNTMKIKFFLPVIQFIEAIPDSGVLPVAKSGDTEADGNNGERWVGSVVDLYLAIFKPDGDGGIIPCPDCKLTIHMYSGADGTSEGIVFSQPETTFENGYAVISLTSENKEYRRPDHPAKIVVANALGTVTAEYSPIFFRTPPVPTPRLADVFDVRGKTLPGYKIHEKYYREDQEYLDGIADSVAIYYHRAIPKDSLPIKVCIIWDSTVTSTDDLKVDFSLAEEGLTKKKDSEEKIFCNTLQPIDASMTSCSGDLCTNVLKIGGLKLSEVAKTGGRGRIISYAKFCDADESICNDSQKKAAYEVIQGFQTDLIDRVAPVPLRVEVKTLRDKGGDLLDRDSLVVVMSEPVDLVSKDNKKSSMDYFLNSATDIQDEASRYASVVDGGTTKVTALLEPALSELDDQGRVRYTYSRENIGPHKGDYLRVTGNTETVYWTDKAEYNVSGSDTLRNVEEDAKFNWNSPTGLDDKSGRLPSPWVLIVGEGEKNVIEKNFGHTSDAEPGPAVYVRSFLTSVSKDEILRDSVNVPGHFVMPDMFGLILENEIEDVSDVYFSYEVEYFTNLGSFVASKSGKIYCDDKFNTEVDQNGKKIQYFDGGKCNDPGKDRNFFIAWNMRSDKGRQVGTGAYIVKFNSFVKLGDHGKDNKQESTSIWGVRRSKIK